MFTSLELFQKSSVVYHTSAAFGSYTHVKKFLIYVLCLFKKLKANGFCIISIFLTSEHLDPENKTSSE